MSDAHAPIYDGPPARGDEVKGDGADLHWLRLEKGDYIVGTFRKRGHSAKMKGSGMFFTFSDVVQFRGGDNKPLAQYARAGISANPVLEDLLGTMERGALVRMMRARNQPTSGGDMHVYRVARYGPADVGTLTSWLDRARARLLEEGSPAATSSVGTFDGEPIFADDDDVVPF